MAGAQELFYLSAALEPQVPAYSPRQSPLQVEEHEKKPETVIHIFPGSTTTSSSSSSSFSYTGEEKKGHTTFSSHSSNDVEFNNPAVNPSQQQEYRLYKRRFIGLIFMTLLNFLTGVERSAFGPVAASMASHFEIPFQHLESFNSATGFSALASTPFVIWILNRAGPKWSLVASCAVYVLGSWLHYAGARARDYDVFVAGSILVSMSTLFAYAAPPRYSRLWFSERGRTSATGLASLSGAAGSAVGAVMAPHIIESTGVTGLTLIFSIVATIWCSLSILLPSKPPTPPNKAAAIPRQGIWPSLRTLLRTPPFWLQLYSFAVSFAAFESTSALSLQIILPYGGTQTEAGNAGAVFVICGILAAFVVSPLLDRGGGKKAGSGTTTTKEAPHLIVSKCLVVGLAIAHSFLLFIPQTGSEAGFYVSFGLLGALSFALLPCSLELQVNWTQPASPEIATSISLAGGFLLNSVFIIVMEQLVSKNPTKKGWGGQPPGPLFGGLVFVAIMMWSAVPFALLTGVGWFRRPEVSKVRV